jgi:hypothetical protein
MKPLRAKSTLQTLNSTFSIRKQWVLQARSLSSNQWEARTMGGASHSRILSKASSSLDSAHSKHLVSVHRLLQDSREWAASPKQQWVASNLFLVNSHNSSNNQPLEAAFRINPSSVLLVLWAAETQAVSSQPLG